MQSDYLHTLSYLMRPLLVAALLSVSSIVAAEDFHKLTPTETIDLGDGVTMEFILIEPGSFAMGGATHDIDERPVRTVNLTRPFYVGRYEVTQEQWTRIMGENPSHFKGGQLPVDNVSWNDCRKFISALREKTGRYVVLPTEAQWEYACRAGTGTEYSFGNEEADLDAYAWHARNSGLTTNPVGQKKPNGWGLYDMHGNVYEWCADWYSEGTYLATDIVDPQGPKSGLRRVLRGGAWIHVPENLRSADRGFSPPDYRSNEYGLRCVLLLDEQSQTEDKIVAAKSSSKDRSLSITVRLQNLIEEGDRLAAEFLLAENEKTIADLELLSSLRREISQLPSPPEKLTVNLSNDVTMELLLVRPGTFVMGSEASASDSEKPSHRVTITRPFYLGKYEVTQAQWMALMQKNPSAYFDETTDETRSMFAVDNVSWTLCTSFLGSLNEKVPGYRFRLPTEAEWEFACRAGTTDSLHYKEGTLDGYAWYGANSGNHTHAVGQKKANARGFHDMYGNVWEWCHDRFGPYSAEAAVDPSGPTVSAFAGARVLRGGAWNNIASHVNSTYRHDAGPNIPMRFYGFRCVAEISVKKK